MAWTNSRIFVESFADQLDGTQVQDFDGDTFHAALFPDSITPSQTVAVASTALGAGVWTGNIFDGSEWATGGKPIANRDITIASSTTVKWSGDNVSSGTSATLAGVVGCLVYNQSSAGAVNDIGVCYNYFGGANSVTDGTFTVVWNAAGIFTIALG